MSSSVDGPAPIKSEADASPTVSTKSDSEIGKEVPTGANEAPIDSTESEKEKEVPIGANEAPIDSTESEKEKEVPIDSNARGLVDLIKSDSKENKDDLLCTDSEILAGPSESDDQERKDVASKLTEDYKPINDPKRITLSSKTDATNVYECETKEDSIIFKWKAVDGAKSYDLMVKDEFLSEKTLGGKIEEAELLENEIQEVKVEKSEQLRIGKTCMTKIVAHGNGPKSESDWKPHLIGGKLVPRNVKAKEYVANPKRCILVTFDAPQVGEADEYKVIPIPGSKIHKTGRCFKKSPVLVEYLRRGIEYSFQVSARHGDKWSEMSLSNSFTTNPGVQGAGIPAQTASNSENVTFNNQGAIFIVGASVPDNTIGDKFVLAQARNIKPLLENKGDKDLLKLEWINPSFGNAEDYKVENYKVEIGKKNEKPIGNFNVDFVSNTHKYQTEEHELDLGQSYDIAITTNYIDIDKDQDQLSDAVNLTVLTRPCRPVIITNKAENDKLRLEWNHCNGAVHYVVNLFIDDKIYTSYMTEQTKFERNFDEYFGFGKTYHIVVDAIGSNNQKNSFTTENTTIGEDHVPRYVEATVTHERVTDPCTQVYLRWKSPEIVPFSYKVTLSNGKECKTTPQDNKRHCVVSGLNAGTGYVFKVIAIHKDLNNADKKSAGCLSNKIQTSPESSQVQNVRTYPGPNPCTSIFVKWNKVNVFKENDEVKYRVIVMTLDEKITTEVETKDNCQMIDGLKTNTFYVTTVAGGNTTGFGINSAKLSFRTAKGKPKKVELVKSGNAASTELILQFPEMEEKPKKELRENTAYSAEIYAEFENGDMGISLLSHEVKTAPGKLKIVEYGCCSDKKTYSSKDLFLKWETIPGVSYYQARIIFERNGETEKEMIITENELTYSCKNESCKYSVQVRAKAEEFGDWSDKKLIDLGPPVLRGIQADLENFDDYTGDQGKNIIIHCDKNQNHQLKYRMQAFCNNKEEGSVQQIKHQLISGNIVEFCYSPNKAAEIYTFELWTEVEGIKGGKIKSNSVLSKPGKVTTVLAIPTEKSPSTKIKISWDAVKPCTGYELLIRRAISGTCECLKRVESTTREYEHFCSQLENEYDVYVRCLWKNTTGDWSDVSKVRLEPPVLENIKVKYDIDRHKKHFRIECKKILRAELNYCMQAFCNGEKEGPIAKKNNANCNDDVVNFGYTPKRYAELYSFDLWAEVSDGFKGKSTRSDIAISRPEKVQTVLHKLDEDNPSLKMNIYWVGVARCGVYEVCVQCTLSEDPECLMKVEKKNYCDYICKNPGENYTVRVRGLYEHCATEWSEKAHVCLAPPRVRNVEINITANPNVVNVTWKPLEKPLTRYVVALYQDNQMITEEATIETQHKFDNKVQPGCICYCTVAAENGCRRGKPRSSQNHHSAPIMIKNLTCKQKDGYIIYEWDAPEPAPEKYLLKWGVDYESLTDQSTEDTFFKRPLVKGARLYELSVNAFNMTGGGKIAKKVFQVSVPDMVKEVASSHEDGIITFEWIPPKSEPRIDGYLVQWKSNNDQIKEETTSETKLQVFGSNPAHSYNLRVKAFNIVGCGGMSEWNTFITAPLPPRNMTVTQDQRNPQTSFLVKYEDDIDTLKKYKVTAVAVGNNKVLASVTTKELYTRIFGLQPGQRCQMKVQTIYRGKKIEELFYV